VSDTPRTDAKYVDHEWDMHDHIPVEFARQLERELNGALEEIEGARLRNISLIIERDRWKAKAEEKIALRREIEHLLGVDSSMTSDEALQAGLEAIHKLNDKIDELKAAAAAHMAVCGKEPK